MNWLLAQAVPPSPSESVGLLEKIVQGGTPLISLAVAVVACLFAYWQIQQNRSASLERAELEKNYRGDLDKWIKDAQVETTARLAEAKQEAKDRAVEVAKLQEDRLRAEKESDATLAQAIRVIEANTKIMERLETYMNNNSSSGRSVRRDAK